jgi:hypothetical protein
MATRPATAGLLDASACGHGFVPWVSSATEQEAGASWPRELSDFGENARARIAAPPVSSKSDIAWEIWRWEARIRLDRPDAVQPKSHATGAVSASSVRVCECRHAIFVRRQ